MDSNGFQKELRITYYTVQLYKKGKALLPSPKIRFLGYT